MREIDKYAVLKKKLQGICDKNNLDYSIRNQKYPFLMTVKPLGGMDAQQTMMEGMENPGDTGYISPDASLVFAYRDGVLTYKISETFTISDALFTKIKNLFKNMHSLWMMYFFREILEHSPGAAPVCDDPSADQDAENCEAEDEDAAEVFEDFMDEEETEDATPEDAEGEE